MREDVESLVVGSWQELEAWWARHLGEDFLAHLNPGATEAAIEELESLVGAPLRADFKAVYRRHDGQAEFYEADGQRRLIPGLFFGLSFMPLSEVRMELERCREMLERFGFEEDCQASVPPGHVRAVEAHPLWVPIGKDGGGNFLAIDLAPDARGTCGQVINCGREERVKYVVAKSLGAFMGYMADELGRGNFALTEFQPGMWELNIGTPEGTTHFFTALPTLFGEASAQV